MAMVKPQYGSVDVDGTFGDFAELMIMFGYIVMFGIVFPFGFALTLLLLVIERRVDGFKIFTLMQRPFPLDAASIGPWRDILEGLSWVGMFTNAALLTWTFQVFDSELFGEGEAKNTRLAYFFVLCCCIVVVKIAIAVLVPDVPEQVLDIQAHHDYVVKGL